MLQSEGSLNGVHDTPAIGLTMCIADGSNDIPGGGGEQGTRFGLENFAEWGLLRTAATSRTSGARIAYVFGKTVVYLCSTCTLPQKEA